MKKLLLILSYFLFQCHNCVAQSNQDSLHKYVVKLSTLPFARNYANIEALNETAEYIKNIIEHYSSRVVEQKFQVETKTYKNIIASFGPEHAPRLIIGAHYDVFGEAPGADANASGVAGILELSRLFSVYEKYLKFRIDLVAFTLKETPYFGTKNMGSYHHAKSMNDNGVVVLGMINLQSIGFYSDKKRTQKYPVFFYKLMHGNRGNFIALIQNVGNGTWGSRMRGLMQQYVIGMRAINFKPIIYSNEIASSDHSNYWAFDYPAIMVTNTSAFRNKNYHYDTDTYETLDYFRMKKVVDMVYQAVIHYRL